MVAEAASPDEGTGHLMCNRGGVVMVAEAASPDEGTGHFMCNRGVVVMVAEAASPDEGTGHLDCKFGGGGVFRGIILNRPLVSPARDVIFQNNSRIFHSQHLKTISTISFLEYVPMIL